jgi:DNA-binding MarR family transcriptional regulator
MQHLLLRKRKLYMHTLKDALENVGFRCMAFATRRTGRAVTNYFNDLLRPADLNVAQFGLLTAIAKLPGRTLREIGETLILDESTVTRNLTILERRNLVQAEGGRGRSGKRMTLTREGEEIMILAATAWRQGNAALVSNISPELLAAGVEFLNVLTEASGALRNSEAANRLNAVPAEVD